MVATVPIGETGLRLDVTYIPESEKMLVAAIGLTADGVHDHELWLVPADGSDVQSLGVVAPGTVRAMTLPAAVTAKLGDGAGLVLTREPIGGKPDGVDAGPVVAKGAFTRV
jgi:anti-sigma-K factor RskA